MLKALAANSEYAMVFTARFPGKDPEPVPGADIIPVKAFDYRTWLRRRTSDGYMSETAKKQSWKQFGIRMINSFPFSILFGEGGLVYFFFLLRKGQQAIDQHNITHLYSSFRPFTDHYAAYWLKRNNPSLCWIADFRDVIVDPHYGHILWPKAHQRFFTRIFHRADVITTVSKGLARNLQPYGDKVITVLNGLEPPLLPIEPVRVPKFTIVYTGSMMLDTRNPRPLFAAVKSLISLNEMVSGDVQMVYAGKDGDQWIALANEYGLQESFVNFGIIGEREVIKLQREACINILLTVSSPELQGVITGKWIEYVEAGSPLLAISKGMIDPELHDMILQLEIGACFSDKTEDLQFITDFILKEYKYWKEFGVNRKPADPERITTMLGTQRVIQPLFDALNAKSSIGGNY